MKRRTVLLVSGGIAAATLWGKTGQTQTTRSILPGETVTLAQGLTGYYVRPTGAGPFPAVLVLMEAFGLNAYIKSVCDRLAKAGYAALAPDFYHGATFSYTDRQGAIGKLKSLQDSVVMAELGKAIDFLSQRKEVKANRIGVVGFCMGGRLAFLASQTFPTQIKAAVCFYGGGIAAKSDPLGRRSLLEQVSTIQAPILLIYGAEDTSIPADEHSRITLALSEQKKRYVLSVFPNAGHGFASSDRQDSYVPAAAEESWEMTFNFFDRHLG
jgi:carboxymethylenebutenolidase